MGKDVNCAIKMVKDFLWCYESTNENVSYLRNFLNIKNSEEYRNLESMYNILIGQGITKNRIIDMICEKVSSGELRMPNSHKGDNDIKEQITSFVNFYYVNLDKYISNKDMYAASYMKESEELFDLVNLASSMENNSNKKNGIKKLFSNGSVSGKNCLGDINKRIEEKKSDLKYTEKLYNRSSECVDFLLELERLFPQLMLLLNIERQMQRLFFEGGYNRGLHCGYEEIQKVPDKMLLYMKENVKGISFPTGEILNRNSYLKTAVNKMKKVFDFLDLEISSSQFVCFDEYLSDPEFIAGLSFIDDKDKCKKIKM